MKKIKTYTHKDQTAFTIPNEFEVDADTQFFILKDEFGAIVLIPENEYSKTHQDELVKNYTTRELN